MYVRAALKKKAPRTSLWAIRENLVIDWMAEHKRLNAQITSISAPDKNKKVLVTVALPDGTYTPGMSAQFSLSKKSETYQNCLPLTALRSRL